MTTLIDASLWIDFTRSRSPARLKQFIAPYILHPGAHVAEPVMFEILRHATANERGPLERQFQTFPVLATPANLWLRATDLGRACRQKGHSIGALDLLIAAVALAHAAAVLTFDEDFRRIASVAGLQVKLLRRPE